MTSRSPESRPWIEILARVGFVAKGVLYATIGMLAGCSGLGVRRRDDRYPRRDDSLALVTLRARGAGRDRPRACGIRGLAMCRRHFRPRGPRERHARAWRCARAFSVLRGAVHLWFCIRAQIQATLVMSRVAEWRRAEPTGNGDSLSASQKGDSGRATRRARRRRIRRLSGVQGVRDERLHRHVNEREVTNEAEVG